MVGAVVVLANVVVADAGAPAATVVGDATAVVEELAEPPEHAETASNIEQRVRRVTIPGCYRTSSPLRSR